MDPSTGRLVPYRFFVDETDSDMCKLRKLANLFPDMKTIIELELFKSNNLTRIIDRLSSIYSRLSTLDLRDDTCHLFLGPYHLCLGSALFAGLRFKNVSAALLAASGLQRNQGEATSKETRRRDAVLRRFRRVVRKLILIRSILDQIRLASILTPFNQYELTSNGIYDLVLAGQQTNGQCTLDESAVAEEVERLRTLNYPEQKSFLLASNFIKISVLLHLLSPSHTAEPNLSPTTVDEATSNTQDPKNIMEAGGLCCSQHGQRTSLVMLPIKSPAPPPTTQLLPAASRHRINSNHSSRRTPSLLSRQNTASSYSESTGSDGYNPMVSTSTPALAPNRPEREVSTSKADASPSFSSSIAPEEEALINRISSLLSNYFMSHPSATMKGESAEIINHSISSSPTNHHNEDTSGDSNLSLASSPPMSATNDFDRLLNRIKTVTNRTLSAKRSDQNHSHLHKPTLVRRRRQQLYTQRTSSCHETVPDDYDPQRPMLVYPKRRLDLSSKSQSLDETNSEYRPLAAAADLDRFDLSTERFP